MRRSERQDLFEIWDYIAEDNLDSADRVLGRLYDAFTRLAQMPGKPGRLAAPLLDRSKNRFLRARLC